MEVENPPEPPPQRVVMKHNTVPNRMMQQLVFIYILYSNYMPSRPTLHYFLVFVNTTECSH